MVVGADYKVVSLLAAQNLDGTVGNHLVGIHVQGCARPALNGVNNKVLMKPAFQNLVACLYNCLRRLFLQQSDFAVGDCRRLFYVCKTVDDFRVHIQTGNLEILCRAHGLYPIVYIFRHILCAH